MPSLKSTFPFTAPKRDVTPKKPSNDKELLLATNHRIKPASGFLEKSVKKPQNASKIKYTITRDDITKKYFFTKNLTVQKSPSNNSKTNSSYVEEDIAEEGMVQKSHNAFETNNSYVEEGSKIPLIEVKIRAESLDESKKSSVIDSELDCDDEYEENIQSDEYSGIKPAIQESKTQQIRSKSNVKGTFLFALSISDSKFDNSFIDFFKKHPELKTYIDKVKEELSAKEELNNEDKLIKEFIEKENSAAKVIDFMVSRSRFVTFPDFSFFVSKHPEFETYFAKRYIAKEKEITESNINTALDQLISHSRLDAVRNISPVKDNIKDRIFSELKDCYKKINLELILKQIEVKKHIVAEALFPSGTFGRSHKDAILRFDTLFGDKEQEELLKAIDIKQEDVMISMVASKASYPTEAKLREKIVSQLAKFINNNKEKADENQIAQITQDLDLINQNYFGGFCSSETGNDKLTEAIIGSGLGKEICKDSSCFVSRAAAFPRYQGINTINAKPADSLSVTQPVTPPDTTASTPKPDTTASTPKVHSYKGMSRCIIAQGK